MLHDDVVCEIMWHVGRARTCEPGVSHVRRMCAHVLFSTCMMYMCAHVMICCADHMHVMCVSGKQTAEFQTAATENIPESQ